jgi:hypothetical protein
LFTVNIIIPKFNKIAINIFGILWMFGSIYEIIIQSEHIFARIIQIIIMIVYILYQNNFLLKFKKPPPMAVVMY